MHKPTVALALNRPPLNLPVKSQGSPLGASSHWRPARGPGHCQAACQLRPIQQTFTQWQ